MKEYNNYTNNMFGTTGMDTREVSKGMIWAVVMLIFGAGLVTTLMQANYFLIALKPAYTVEELMENGVSEGMHVKGDIPYIYDCFANRENFESNKVEACYYALPARDGFLIVKVSTKKQPVMEKLLQETAEFLNGGSFPVSTVSIEGHVEKAQGRLPYLLGEYMQSMGYTKEQVDAMGEPFVIVESADSLRKARISLPVGVIMQCVVVLGVVFYVFYSRRKAT